MKRAFQTMRGAGWVSIAVFILSLLSFSNANGQVCGRTIVADVVALDQPFFYNRLGASNPAGMIYALRRDVVNKTTLLPESAGGVLSPGLVMLRPDKRPRPLVLRMNVGDCLTIHFTNLLSPIRADAAQPATREAGIHVNGMHLVNSIADDGSFVGLNSSSLAAPGQTISYTFYAEFENAYLLYNMGSTVGGEGGGGTLAYGLFGMVNVEPAGAEWYRNQLTHEEKELIKTGVTPQGHPLIDYDARYPSREPFISEGKVINGVGLPVVRILDPSTNRIVHSDLNAIITGPNRGNFNPGTHSPSTPVNPNQDHPFREFSVIFHDDIQAVQAFPGFFNDPVFTHTLHGVRDGFAINYGTAGAGSEVIANRLGVGPMLECAECKYEEFFLTSWVVSDPGMVVDRPANFGLENLRPGQAPLPGTTGPKATTVLYPDDPSTLWPAYLNDRVKMRNVHAGPFEHHIFHLHAHQWVFAPSNDKSSYIDFQQIGTGSSYTYDIAFGGSGNRNKTPGDAILHCHFYPHFAQGMWGLYRVHDVFEEGTVLEGEGVNRPPFALREGRPVIGARALPDAEIQRGVPIPFVVPIPGQAMAPMPAVAQLDPLNHRKIVVTPNPITGETHPGFPFFIPGVAGHRPPSPPLDLIHDGGLPRHVIVGGTADSRETRLDFHKETVTADAEQLPESGTVEELAAMDYHAQKFHLTFRTDGTPAQFRTNGAPPVRGAPYADPCIDDQGDPILPGRTPSFIGATANTPTSVQFGRDNPRTYKAAVIQLDAVFNKVGWHHPQQRIITLWEDVAATYSGARPPEPFVIRWNTLDCGEFWHTNLVPNVYELDDYQVRTPTDIISQHIHLVKFDVTSSDGAANGWNYEDGTFSPGEVNERIRAINAFGGLRPYGGGNRIQLQVQPHPFFNVPGARTTVQRIFIDPILDYEGKDRGVGNIFTHDHFGPSTHQQVGLYGTMLVEPAGSQWVHNETGAPLHTRGDGGPTTWQAAILTPNTADSYREFFLQWGDFQHAYEREWDGRVDSDSFLFAINPSVRLAAPRPIFTFPSVCPGGVPRPCPEAISTSDPGTFVVNYRSEPVGLRIFDPNRLGPDQIRGAQAAGNAGDLSFAFASIPRAIPRLNNVMRSAVRNTPVDPNFSVHPGDPFTAFPIGAERLSPQLTRDVGRFDPATPLLRVYNNDNVRIRLQVGATEESHVASIHGLKWLQEFANPSSGWRNSQSMGISEQFQLNMPILQDIGQQGVRADYLWSVNSANEGFWTGTWGLLRSYDRRRNDLIELPNNIVGRDGLAPTIVNREDFIRGVCPNDAPTRTFDITAVRAADALPTTLPGIGRTLIYNSRPAIIPTLLAEGRRVLGGQGPLHDPTALLYVMTGDLNPDGTLKPDAPIEPLILRANAGDCIEVTLRNRILQPPLDMDGVMAYHPVIDRAEQVDRFGRVQKTTFNANDTRPSSHVGIHVQLLDYNIRTGDGTNVGINPVQTVGPGGIRTYRWYAGDLRLERLAGNTARLIATPIEFGGLNLMPADRLEQASKGLVGALVILPQGSTWVDDPGTRASSTVTTPEGTFRDFVAVLQNNVNLRYANNRAVPNILAEGGAANDSEDSGHKAINYRTEPLWFRLGFPPDLPFGAQRNFQTANAYSNSLLVPGLGIATGDPQTPIFRADEGEVVRFHFIQAGGVQRNMTLTLHGHLWQRSPYNEADFNGDGIPDGPTRIADNPTSQMLGSQEGIGPSNHFDIIPGEAGGLFGVTGDFLYRMMDSGVNLSGMWGIFRVE